MTPKQKEKIELVLYRIYYDYWDAKLNLDDRDLAHHFIHKSLIVVDAFASVFGDDEIEKISDEQSDRALKVVNDLMMRKGKE